MTASIECRDPDRQPIPESPAMRIYEAEDHAALKHPAELLDGSTASAQEYVDRVTRSHKWCSLATGRLSADGASRKIIVLSASGYGSVAYTDSTRTWRGRALPYMSLGTKPYPESWHPSPGRPAAVRDPWLILHELAHFLPDDGQAHGRRFARNLHQLVSRFLGAEHARELAAQLSARKLKYSAPPGSGW